MWRRLGGIFGARIVKADGRPTRPRSKRRRATPRSENKWRPRLAEPLEVRLALSASPTSISIAASQTTALYGQAITLTATVAASPTAPSEGTVAFMDGGATLGTASVIAGIATLTNVRLGAGTHQITASYSDSLNNFAASATIAQSNSLITTIAGNGTAGSSGINGPATSTELNWPEGVALNSAGDLFIADTYNDRVLEVNHVTGIVTVAAGTGTFGYSGDGGPATSATFYSPTALAFDNAGDLFIADFSNNRVRKVDHATGIITTVAGNGNHGFSGDGGPATSAQLWYPAGLAFDAAGNLFIADQENERIREVDAATGIITTVAGNGINGYAGDGGAATSAELFFPQGLAIDSSGNLFVADRYLGAIREIQAGTGIITTVAGNGILGYSGDGGAATSAELDHPYAVAVDPAGNLFIAEGSGNRIRVVDKLTGIITTIAGDLSWAYGGDGGPAGSAKLYQPEGIALDSAGNLVIADTINYRIREIFNGAFVRITPASLTITADNQTKTYGAAVPTLTVSYTGFVNGDSAASLTTPPTLSTTATSASSVAGGPYAITVSGAADSNYTLSYVSGSLSVTPAPLTITADNKTKTYGAALPTLTYSYSGFVNGDSAASLTTQPVLAMTATAASPIAGNPYAITVSGAADLNYTIIYVNGWLNVTPAHIVAAADVYVIGSGTVFVSTSNGVLANDRPAGFLTVGAGPVAGATGGTFTFHADGSFTYVPPANFIGYDHAAYTASDGQGDAGVGVVTVLSHFGGVAWKFYESVLGRNPDDAGLESWIDHLAAGGSTGDMAVAFSESDELLDQIVGGYYQQYLGRAADAAGLAGWKSVWRAAGGPETVQANIAASPEFFRNAGGTIDGWLTALYQRVLDRTPDAQGLNYWAQQLLAGMSETNVALSFFDSPEAFRDDVTGWFQQDFGVEPTADQLSFYVNEMLAGASDAQIEQQLASSPSYSGNVPSSPPGTGTPLPDYLT